MRRRSRPHVRARRGARGGAVLALMLAASPLGGQTPPPPAADATAPAARPATPGAAPATPPDPDVFWIRDMGMSLRKPSSWHFVNVAESGSSRHALVARLAGAEAAAAVSVNSVNICQINRHPFDHPLDVPNPGVAVALQNMAGTTRFPDARTYATQAVASLKLVFRDVEYVSVLDPVKIGSLDGFKHTFRARIDPAVYDGVLMVEQHYALQGSMAICITYMDSAENWPASKPDFEAIQKSIEAPREPPSMEP